MNLPEVSTEDLIMTMIWTDPGQNTEVFEFRTRDDLSPWLTDEPPDVGDPPAGWCDKTCRCGQPCGEFIDHNGLCACLSH